jgi:hypothetical protein
MSNPAPSLLLPHITCQRQRANLRLGYLVGTCQQCGPFGPCQVYVDAPKPAHIVLEVSGLLFDQAELNCEDGNC